MDMKDRVIVYYRDLLTQHLIDGQPLTAEEVSMILGYGLAEAEGFEERLPNAWFHSSLPAFPEGWSQEDQEAANQEAANQEAQS